MSYRSFIDILFIILLATLVMLTQTVDLGAVDTAVARIGPGGISRVRADQVQVVVVGADELQLDGTTWREIDSMGAMIRPLDPVLLVTADAEVSHHRVMDVWSELHQRELDVKLGARPAPPETVGAGDSRPKE